MLINENTVVSRVDDDIAETDFDGKAILLHIENGEYYNFNETATDLWEWLKDGQSPYDLASKLSNKYNCTVEECLPDILTWVNTLLEKNIVITKPV